MSLERRSLTLALGAVLLWSTVATAFKLTLRTISPVQLVFQASVVSFFFFFVLALFRGIRLQCSTRVILYSALLGLLNPFLYYLLLFAAYDRLLGQQALVLNYTWPIVMALLAVPLRGEKWVWKTFFALGLSFCGVILVVNPAGTIPTDPAGIALALGSSLVWAVYWLLNVRDSRSAEDKLLMTFFFGSLYALSAVLLFSSPSVPAWKTGAGVVYIGLLEMGLTFLLWLKALQSSSTPRIGNLVYLTPFFSVVLLHTVLGEPLLTATFPGLALIVGGILIQRLSWRKRR